MGNCFSIFHTPSCWDSLLTPWNELEGVAGEASGQGHPSHRDGGGAAKAPPPHGGPPGRGWGQGSWALRGPGSPRKLPESPQG